jgi:hypothetical protein
MMQSCSFTIISNWYEDRSALHNIKLKHLKGWKSYNQGTYIYQVTVYTNSPKYRYTSFCTTECTKSIDSYLHLRKRREVRIYNKDPQTSTFFLWKPIHLSIKNFNKKQYAIIP